MNTVTRTYVRQFVIAMVGYSILVPLTIWVIGRMDETIWRIPMALMPVIPASFALQAFIRYLNGIDEFLQKVHFNAIAVAAGATGMITFSYGFLENVGFPSLSWMFIFPMMIVIWGIALFAFERRYR